MSTPIVTATLQPLTTLKRVGERQAERLAKLSIFSVQDLLLHLPLRYQDRTRLYRLDELRAGMEVLVEGEVVDNRLITGRTRMLLGVISDGERQLTVRFFRHTQAMRSALALGKQLRLFGEIRLGYEGGLELIHPEFESLNSDDKQSVEQTLTPVYPTTEGINQATLRRLIDQAFALLEQDSESFFPELLPAPLREPLFVDTLADALRALHHPLPGHPVPDREVIGSPLHPALQRLVFEELLAHHLSLRQLRGQWKQRQAPPVRNGGTLARRLLDSLPFQLTDAQQRVIIEILADMAQGHPMQRLVQGDVGCGKTLVAAVVLCHVVEAGYQVAVMAPTELLAEQHRDNFAAWMQPLEVEVAWLSGRLKGNARKQAMARVSSGEARVVVGTHALFQKEVAFHDLGLVVVDEQHRFGVHQRLALREKGGRGNNGGDGWPHQLIMTATPIPRTLAMTAYADLALSVIDQLPPGRSPVTTAAVPETRRGEVIKRIREVCSGQGRQAYWVCTLIDESDLLQAEAAENTAVLLADVLPTLTIGLVHGRMKAADKQQAMRAFKNGETDLLVATTVIEVGVDVPNASLMIIENAERLGLAQLHQLRGRVGRGSTASACLLMYHPPLSTSGRARLGILRDSSDGFEVAQRDLELRGPGEVLGTRQTGQIQFKVADLIRDAAMIEPVETAGEQMMRNYADAVGPLVRRWLTGRERYGEV